MTKRQRHKCYKEVLEELRKEAKKSKERYGHYDMTGLCIYLGRMLPDGYMGTPNGLIFDSFPELKNQKPKGKRLGGMWWGDNQFKAREIALQKCIKQTA